MNNLTINAYVAHVNETGPAPGEPGIEMRTVSIQPILKDTENTRVLTQNSGFGVTLTNLTSEAFAQLRRGAKLKVTIEVVE